jgi:hypothetical protein
MYVCSVVAGGGRFLVPATTVGRESPLDAEAVVMLLLAWHVNRAVPVVACRWPITECHRVKLVNTRRFTVVIPVTEGRPFLRCP